jgi:sugar phosphate isomerase/epimerase
MKRTQIAAQFYTLRAQCQTAPDLAAAAKKVRAIGYTAAQISGIGPIPEDEVVRIMSGEGLTICATHEPADLILNEPARVVERLQKLGCRLTAYPFPKDIDMTSLEAVRQLARRLDAAGALLRAAGFRLGYHNHALEFYRHAGLTALEHIYRLTDPANLVAELDTYWVQAGGGDPAAWCERMAGRLPFIHLKDFGLGTDFKPVFREIGQGNLDWPRIIRAAERSGCEWFIVEQDTCPGDPFDSLRISFDYLASLAAG